MNITYKIYDEKYNLKLYELITSSTDYFTQYIEEQVTISAVLEEFVYDLPNNCSINDKKFYLIFDDMKLVGFFDYVVKFPRADAAMIGYVFLCKEYRGLKIGSEVLKFIEQELIRSDILTLNLNVALNSLAHKFWLAKGFNNKKSYTSEYGEEMQMEKVLICNIKN